MKNVKPLFALSNVKKTYATEKNPALDIESLIIPKNSLVAVLGYSGSGKTTLLNLIGLLDRPDQIEKQSPEILFYDDDNHPQNLCQIKNINNFRRQHFGFIFQESYLLGNLTCRANIEIPLHANQLQIDSKQIDNVLKLVGMSKEKHARLPSDISGGEAQKIAFARSIIHGPDVILADEPTSSLDYDKGLQLIHFLKNICTKDKSVVWITHNIHQAVMMADYIIVLKDGKAYAPIANPKKYDDVLNLLRQDETVSLKNHHNVEIQPPEKSKNTFNMFQFLITFAVSDIFPKASENKKALFFGYGNTQKLNMISLILVICLSMLLLNISYAFKNFFILSVSDPLINKIIIQKKIRGSDYLSDQDLKTLSNLMWARPKNIVFSPIVVWPEKLKNQGLVKIRKATMGAFGIYRGTIDCYMSRETKESTLSGIIDISMAAVNVNDPVLNKLCMIDQFSNKKPVSDAFMDESNKIKQDKEGIVITRSALEKHLDYHTVPDTIDINYYNSDIINLPILGVAERLPYNVDIIVTQGWYLQQYWRIGQNDPKPGYYQVSIYVQDKIDDGLPVCQALEGMGYTGIGNTKNKLHWIKNMIDIIFVFFGLVIIVISVLAFSFLGVSYANAMKSKQKELGILMAKGFTKIKLYFMFFVEIFIVWGISIIITYPIHYLFLFAITKFVSGKFDNQQLSIDAIFHMPDYLWPFVLLASLSLAFLSVFLGIRGILKHNLASIMRSGD